MIFILFLFLRLNGYAQQSDINSNTLSQSGCTIKPTFSFYRIENLYLNINVPVSKQFYGIKNCGQGKSEGFYFLQGMDIYSMDLHLNESQKTYNNPIIVDGLLKPDDQTIFIDMNQWAHPEQTSYQFDLRRR